MIDERLFIRRVENANADEFGEILRTVDQDQERALRAHLGDAAFERMRNSALELGLTRAAAVAKSGNVVVLHGILGGELSENTNKIWVNVFRLAAGEFTHLAMDQSGKSVNPVSATGMLKKYYGDLLLGLAKSWNVQSFPFDWRADIRDSADRLSDSIAKWFPNRPVHMVAHSMGGLVARAAILRHPDMWRVIAPGKLVMLGTPNYGSFAIPLLFNGLNDTINTVATIDVAHNAQDLLQIAKNFSGVWQMLPSVLQMSTVEPLYSAATYPNLDAPQRPLDDARQFQLEIQGVIDAARMIYVAGYNRRTANSVSDYLKLNDLHSYGMTMRGDGTVPHSLGLLDGVATFYVDEEHSRLPANTRVIQAMNSLLSTGTVAEPLLWHGLSADVPDAVRGASQSGMQDDSLYDMAAHQARVRTLRDSLQVRGAVSGAAAPLPIVTPEEGQLQDFLFRGMSLDFDAGEDQATSPALLSGSGTGTNVPEGRIRIHVVHGGIDSVVQGDSLSSPASPGCTAEVPIDAVSVGHYIGVKPVYAELAIDRAISDVGQAIPHEELQTRDLIVTEFTERGTLRGDLGQTFLIPDPRDRGAGSRRVIAIAGMGPVGRFGVPETAVLARELCWSVSRLGKRHLATVLIGSGAKNLTIEDAVSGWMQGVQRAIGDCSQDGGRCLEAITFVEYNPDRAEQLKRALDAVRKDLAAQNFTLDLCDPPLPDSGKDAGGKNTGEPKLNPAATRITAELRENVFRFGAITADASIPEREFSLNPKLVFEVNDLIAAERDPVRLSRRGEFLRRLLIPRDLEDQFLGSAPIVLACDSTLARIHWELMTQPHPQGVTPAADGNYLGLCRGFTRQLRTVFAPLPEPPPPAKRKLRVLIVADTASDMPLPGARAEALAVRRQFEAVTTAASDGNSVEVTSMIGPNEANWALVMEKLLDNPPFDILHYAGHCSYNEKDPEGSGWIFSNGNVLSARELARVDRIPKFVFSNACESGVTPSRSELRSAALAPGFAEAFFARGVGNFVCTAWPVDDGPARDFALRLYSGMLGLATSSDGSRGPEPMFKAMREARRVIMKTREGRNWGAYQHYGNPFFQLFR